LNASYLYALLDQVNPATAHLVRPKFKDQMDQVHIDEKWFHMCQDGEGYLLVADEEPPVLHQTQRVYWLARSCSSVQKRVHGGIITPRPRGMARLEYGPLASKYTLAQRSSVNQPAGTTEWLSENIGHELYRDLLMDHVLPEIINKWPVGQCGTTQPLRFANSKMVQEVI
jgi:hypothetical protein